MSTGPVGEREHPAAAASLPGLARLKSRWWEEGPLVSAVDLGLARDRETFDQAFRLAHDRYVARGYMAPHPTGWRLSLHNALPKTKVFVARVGRRVIATMTLITDSPLGLPMGEIYGSELRTLREAGRRIAEASALAVDPAYRRHGMPILMRLNRMMVLYASEVGRMTDLCITVNPHHAALYRTAFHFEALGPLRRYRKVNGAPAVALRFDLGLVQASIRDRAEGRAMTGGVYDFLLSSDACRQVLARITTHLEGAAFSAEEFDYFLRRHSAWTDASAADRAYVGSWYGERGDAEGSATRGLNFGELTLRALALTAGT